MFVHFYNSSLMWLDICDTFTKREMTEEIVNFFNQVYCKHKEHD